jgi:hypothetical protein
MCALLSSPNCQAFTASSSRRPTSLPSPPPPPNPHLRMLFYSAAEMDNSSGDVLRRPHPKPRPRSTYVDGATTSPSTEPAPVPAPRPRAATHSPSSKAPPPVKPKPKKSPEPMASDHTDHLRDPVDLQVFAEPPMPSLLGTGPPSLQTSAEPLSELGAGGAGGGGGSNDSNTSDAFAEPRRIMTGPPSLQTSAESSRPSSRGTDTFAEPVRIRTGPPSLQTSAESSRPSSGANSDAFAEPVRIMTGPPSLQTSAESSRPGSGMGSDGGEVVLRRIPRAAAGADADNVTPPRCAASPLLPSHTLASHTSTACRTSSYVLLHHSCPATPLFLTPRQLSYRCVGSCLTRARL